VRLDDLVTAVSGRPGLGGLAVRGPTGVEVTDVVHDSRAVGPGALFCCVPGDHVDGHHFAPEAVAAGAVAVLCERPVETGPAVAQLHVGSVRAAMGPVASACHGDPSRSLQVAGITGTNGKTTTAHLLRSILEADGRPAVTIGTLTGARTTPEATELQARLAQVRRDGGRAVAMEVSSHALAQRRVDGTRFAVAVFTNLSVDHLDYHGDLEAYYAAKASLFAAERSEIGVVNLDDEHGRRLQREAPIRTIGYSLVEAEDLRLDGSGSTWRWRGRTLRLPLAGRFNVSNALAAATAAGALRVGLDAVADGLAGSGPVPGRFELVDAGQPFTIVVDYAHTPDGLEQLLTATRELAGGGRVIVVFGCGGDRDRGKRPLMGSVAVAGADLVVLTSDNPRDEDPEAIAAEVRAGIGEGAALEVELDRRRAIALALAAAGPGDVVVLAGKGHETTQTIGALEAPFDDRVVAGEEWRRRTGVPA
jgi:UDP-N-acetylmuramoyl-L-alanyl-D-glutamate--2,6-diaminopimelate ligase